jgi:hypothetical protein
LETDDDVYGLWLNHKGRVLADSFVVKGTSGELWVGSYFSAAATVRERLEAYVIADDVEITDETAEWGGITLLGIDEAEASALGGAEGVRFRGRRSRAGNVELLLPVSRWAKLKTDIEAREASIEEMERWRIEAAIPAVPLDLGPGELPNEGGLDIDAVSYSKGCYLGQEVMARLKTMGQVRRRLKRVRGQGAVPLAGSPLFQGAKRVGEMRSSARCEGGFVGLALISLLNFQTSVPLALSENGDACLEVVEETP